MLKSSHTLTLLQNENLANYSNFKIGGNAKLLAKCKTVDSLLDTINYATQHSMKYKIIGGGTNLLFDDLGYDGIIIRYEADRIEIQQGELYAEAGCPISKLIQFGITNSFGGYEFMSGVPTLLGGALTNNFGAYQNDLASHVLNVTILRDNQIVYLNPECCEFGYHSSIFQNKPTIILSAKLTITPSSPQQISSEVVRFIQLRGTSQPITYANCGSVFKREGEVIPAKLIDDAHLKGTRIGDAEVSRIHSGFIINRGNASCKDVLSLIELIQLEILKKYNIMLHPEIEYLPF